MIQPSNSRFDDDPEELELPPFGQRAEDDESWQPDDDSDLDIEQDDKDRGLDADIGFNDEEGEAAADDERAEDDESWLESGEPRAGILGEDDGAVDEADEDGWTEGSEPPAGSPDDFAEDIVLEEGTGGDDDRGLEGFSDEGTLADLDLEKLPPLDGSLAAEAESDDGDDDALGAEFLSELAAAPDGGPESPAPQRVTHARGRSLDACIESVFEGGPSPSWLIASEATGVAWNGELLVATAGARAEARFESDETVLALAAFETPVGLHVALVTGEALLCSRDGGRSFAAAEGADPALLSGAMEVAWAGGEQGPRLWLGAPERGCFVSEDLGAHFRRVEGPEPGAALLRGEHGLTRLERGQLPFPGRAQGWRFERAGGFELGLAPEPLAAVAWRARAGTWQTTTRVRFPAVLVADADPASLYFIARGTAGRLALMRSGELQGSADQWLCELPLDTGEPLWLAGSHQHGQTILQLALERAWVRVVLDPAAARRAS